MTEKRFIVSIDNKNGVGLYDGDIRLLYFQFNNIQDATECKDALKHQCSLMNELYEENGELKKENEKLTVQKLEIRKWVNDKISYLEKKYEFGQTEYKGCPMHNIQFGINILKELRKYWEEQEND